MRVVDILTATNIAVAAHHDASADSKDHAIAKLAALLANETRGVATSHDIERVLAERERLASTGVGGGVAVPHGEIDGLQRLVGAMLLCRDPIAFDAIDGEPVTILFAIIAPKSSRGEHLKALARVSRLLRDEGFRARLLRAPSGHAAFDLIQAEEGGP